MASWSEDWSLCSLMVGRVYCPSLRVAGFSFFVLRLTGMSWEGEIEGVC